MSDYIRADAWIGLCELIDELGGDSAGVLSAAGLSTDSLLPVDRYLPAARFLATLHHAAEYTGRKDFGLQLGLRRQLTQIGVVGLALQNGASWRSIIHIAARIGHVANPLVTYVLEPTPTPDAEFLWIEPTGSPAPGHAQAIERTVAFICESARSMVRPDLVPIAIQFQHGRIAAPEAYLAALGVAPTFDQPKTGLTVTTADLDKPLASRSEELGSLAIAYLEANELIAANDLVRAARLTARSLIEMREGSAENLARALCVEIRTLQRRLKKDDASIEGVFDDARRALVERLLADDLHSIAEITHTLGYATPATLTRNCKRWFGDTPGNLRAQYRGAAD